jgi:hypothetical protein
VVIIGDGFDRIVSRRHHHLTHSSLIRLKAPCKDGGGDFSDDSVP